MPASASMLTGSLLRRPRRSIQRRIIGQYLLLSAVTVVLLVSLSFAVARALQLRQLASQLSSLAASREDLLERTIARDRERTAFLARRPEVLEAVTIRSPTATAEQLLSELRDEHVPAQGVTLFLPSGRVLLSRGRTSPLPARMPQQTVFLPHIDPRDGWMGHDVYAPVRATTGELAGILAVHYSAAPLLAALFTELSLGKTGEVFFWADASGEKLLLRSSLVGGLLRVLPVPFPDSNVTVQLLQRMFQGEEGIGSMEDSVREPLLVSYRSVLSIGWGVIVAVERADALRGVRNLALLLLGLGLVILCFAGFFGLLIAKSFTAPLLHLTRKVCILQPGRWGFAPSVRTGDELEVLDLVIADLARRLQSVYTHLEEQVLERTEELRRQYALDRTILESIQHGVIVIDGEGRVTDANPAACRLMGLPRQRVIGASGSEALPLRLHGQPYPASKHPFALCLRDAKVFRAQPGAHLALFRLDQTLLPIFLIVTPLEEHGRVLGAIAVFQDMTAERQMDYLKSEFIALASHQLRTPLSAIRWYTELLQDGGHTPLSPEQKSYIDELHTSASRMANLIDALLHVARLEEGATLIEKKQTDIVAFLRTLAEEFRGMVKDSHRALALSLPGEPAFLRTDPMLLQVVLQNLFSNALKYSREGSEVRLSLAVRDSAAVISVEDHGMGIPARDQERVFEKFFRASNARTVDTTGSGLGLYMAKTVIERLGGSITFASVEGEGTTFTVRLPL